MSSDHEAEIRASVAAHADLGPGYDDAVAEGLVERIGAEIDKRIDARLGQFGAVPGAGGPAGAQPGVPAPAGTAGTGDPLAPAGPAAGDQGYHPAPGGDPGYQGYPGDVGPTLPPRCHPGP